MVVLVALNGEPIPEQKRAIGVPAIAKVDLFVGIKMISFVRREHELAVWWSVVLGIRPHEFCFGLFLLYLFVHILLAMLFPVHFSDHFDILLQDFVQIVQRIQRTLIVFASLMVLVFHNVDLLDEAACE